MRITSRGFTAVTVGLVSAVLLVGCSSNSTKPTVLPPLPSSSAAPTPATTTPASSPTVSSPTVASTPSASASTQPSQQKTDALASANRQIEAAVRVYYATVDQAIGSQSALDRMKTMFGPGCSQCVSDASNISKLLKKRWKVSGGTYHLLRVKGTAHDTQSGAATVTFNVSAATIRDPQGKLVATEDAHNGRTEGLTVARVGNKWRILGYISFGSTT